MTTLSVLLVVVWRTSRREPIQISPQITFDFIELTML